MSRELTLPALEGTAPEAPATPLGRWLFAEEAQGAHLGRSRWYWVLWLTGVDYFSTLGYQPGIALLAAGAVSPVATMLLILVTLFGALPVYVQVARHSFAGQGSLAMLESLLPGWTGKLLVLVLLGFAATDFVITMTLSAADAAVHVTHNPFVHAYLGEGHLWLTFGFLAVLAAVFLVGFHEAIVLAALVCIPYILLNVVVIVAGVREIARHPELVEAWRVDLRVYGDTPQLVLAAILVFPKLALGLSGFETGVSVMPLIASDDAAGAPPRRRVRATRELLVSAALIMSVLLLSSSVVTSILVPPAAYSLDGPANGRVLAFLAHDLLGHNFGTAYDISTILILWFAGASAMTGMLNLIPRYLPRFGMAPQWIAHTRPLVLLLFVVTLVVTAIFRADVEAQGGAYATGVLALILSAAVAVTLSFWQEFKQERTFKKLAATAYFAAVSAVFAYTLIDNIIVRPDGVFIASVFILTVIVLGAASRYWRAKELRVSRVTLDDNESAILWLSLVGKSVNLVPLRTTTPGARLTKAAEIRHYYMVEGPLAFVHVHLVDNRSEFLAPLRVRVREEANNLVVDVYGAIAIANTLAYISELIQPISLFLGLTRQNLVSQALRYLMWGEGETGLMVYTVLLRRWERMPEEHTRPLIFLMSE